MRKASGEPDPPADTEHCAFILDTRDGQRAAAGFCEAPRRPGSPYCERHHRLCHLPLGGAAERRHLCEFEALAKAVGGRRGRVARQPPTPLLRQLDRIARASSRSKRSRIVRESDMVVKQHAKLRPDDPHDGGPTPERRRQGAVERLDRAISDGDGRPSRPFRAVDTLAIMQRRGSISAGMRQAGEDFRIRFAQAQLDPLRALDMSHLRLGDRTPRRDSDGPGLRIEAARASVWRAIQAVGGIASPGGSCLWHVLGWERPLREWALERGWSGRRVSQESASGVLIAALGVLEAHFVAHR